MALSRTTSPARLTGPAPRRSACSGRQPRHPGTRMVHLCPARHARPGQLVRGECQIFVERHFFASTLVSDAQTDSVPIAEVVSYTDKVIRAVPAAERLHAGRVWFPAGAAWLT